LIFTPVLLMALGAATLLAALNVAYRDFRHVIPFLVQLWMFATPAIYMQVVEPPTPISAAPVQTPPISALSNLPPNSPPPTPPPPLPPPPSLPPPRHWPAASGAGRQSDE